MSFVTVAKHLALSAVLLTAGAANAAAVLLIDDDQGQAGSSTWTSTLAALGHSVTVETLAATGNPVSNLSSYQAVIWSNGDAAYTNLTAANVTALTNYLNGGGRLLYGGAHSVYDETAAHGFIQNYLGLKQYQGTMPTISNCGGTASASGALGNVTLQCMSTGFWNNMMSGFHANLPTTTDLLLVNAGNISDVGMAIGAINETSTYRAMTWGFDLNQVAAGQRAAVLDSALDRLLAPAAGTVPEPAGVALTGLALAAMAMGRRKKARASQLC